jgi:hypothetical protein
MKTTKANPDRTPCDRSDLHELVGTVMLATASPVGRRLEPWRQDEDEICS